MDDQIMRKTVLLLLGLAVSAGLLAAGPAAANEPGYPPSAQPVLISNASTGFYLQTDNQNEQRPQGVQVWWPWPLANGGSGAIWQLQQVYGEHYVIETEPINDPSPACLTVPNGAKNNVPLTVTDCDGGAAQDWIVREDGTSQTYTITPAAVNFRQWAITSQSQNYAAADVYVALKHFTGTNAPTEMRWKIDATTVPAT
jgi:ricin-type beta-trefoil lectin protein